MRKISKLTEKTAEIKSSDGIQLGEVEEIAGNEIIMDSHIGERARFMLPKDMISRIRRKTVYLNLTKDEFEAWWEKEGSLHVAELPGRIEVALGKKLVGDDLTHLKEQIRTAFERNFDLGISEKERERLYLEQEEIRQSFSTRVRKMLHSDEWVFYLLDLYERRPKYLSLAEDVFLVTSKRLIRYKSDGTRKDNWIVPLERIKSITSSKEYRSLLSPRDRVLPHIPIGELEENSSLILTRRGRRVHKILTFECQKNGNIRKIELPIPIWAYASMNKIGLIEEHLSKFTGVHVVKKKGSLIWIIIYFIIITAFLVAALMLL